MPNEVREPSAVIWDWRRVNDPEARTREAAAARQRGVLGGVIGLAVAAFVHHWKPTSGFVVGGVTLLFLAIALASPLTLYPRLMRLFDLFAHAVGTGVTWGLMTFLFYLFFLPAGLLLRAAHKLAITTGFDRGRPSYWKAADERGRTPEAYRKQF